MRKCGVCERIEMIHQGENPWFVKELKTGYVVIGDYQRFKGYTVFICKEHATELHQLEPAFRYEFLKEMSIVAEAVYRAFQPEKLNYELLGVGNNVHMHWHIFPRNAGDTPQPGPVWKLAKGDMYAEQYRPDEKELDVLKGKLREALETLLEPVDSGYNKESYLYL